MSAFGAGTLVVASAGNGFQTGNRPQYPADYHHVLTVAATNQQNQPSSFSSSSLAVDLAAPGEGIPVALPLAINPTGYDVWDGTSFSAPMVSGAAAWVWTVRGNLDKTQIFDLMRFSARDIWSQGYDKDTGFGLLDVPAALARTAPPVDPQEPNEDVFVVKPNGLFAQGAQPLTAPGRARASIRARDGGPRGRLPGLRPRAPERPRGREAHPERPARGLGTRDEDGERAGRGAEARSPGREHPPVDRH
jgi:subtilisin family serine protease